MKISSRLYTGFGLLVMLAVISSIVNLMGLNSISDVVSNLHSHPLTVSNYTRDIKANVLYIHRYLADAVLSENPVEIDRLENEIIHIENETYLIFNSVEKEYLGPELDVKKARTAFSDWHETITLIFNHLRAGDRKRAIELTGTEESEHVDYAVSKLQVIMDYARNKADIFLTNAKEVKSRAYRWSSIIFFIKIVIGILITFLFTRNIKASIKEVTDMANDIAEGRNISVPDTVQNDEISHITLSLSKMVQANQQIIRQARAISEGNYGYQLKARSEEDVLGKALIVMNQALKDAREEQIKLDWFNEGQKNLNLLMRGDSSVYALCEMILSFLADFLEAQIGTFYIVYDDGRLHLAATFGHLQKKGIPDVIEFGEGLAGQAAQSQELFNVRDIPEDYFKIKSGTGDRTPTSLLIVPFISGDTAKGVMELGSFQAFSEVEVRFLKTVGETIAIRIHSVYSRLQVENLLDKTKKQAEELLAQQEELRRTNEEMEEQAQVLEEQKEKMNIKNLDLIDAQRQLEERAKDIETASRYKSEFLANMSHELRTPLNSIILLSQLLSENRESNLSEKQVEYARAVQTSGHELLKLINEILDLSKVESGKIELTIESIPISDIVSGLKMQFRNIAEEKKIGFEIVVDSSLPGNITTDRQRLEQVLKNLLSNAFKFTEKGTVKLVISRPDTESPVSGFGPDPRSRISFTVSDTGIGIPEDKLKIIFEAFQQADGTTSRKYGGTGLGLSISRELAGLLGGKLKVRSSKGEGSVFTLVLPAKFEHRVKGTKKKSGSHKRPDKDGALTAGSMDEIREYIPDDRKDTERGDKSILIVEDDREFARVLRDVSREKGFKALVVDSGENALLFADHYSPSAVILDVKLPGMNGWTVISKLKDDFETRHIPVHFISASEKNHNALRMGALDYLTKPVNMEDLELLFSNIEKVTSKTIKELLIIEDNPVHMKMIKKLLEDPPVNITEVSTGEEALKQISQNSYDCIILDIGLPDMSGFDLLSRIKNNEPGLKTPIVVYTGKELTGAEKAILDEYTESIVLKGASSPGRLLDEVALFLHLVEENLPKEKREMLKLVHNKEYIFRDKNILVADDDMRNVFALTCLLEGKSINVFGAKNGLDALRILEERDDIHLVLMDIMMPEMDGYETIREIRKNEKYKNLPVIALTAKAMTGDRAKCISAGASDYLSKPVDKDKLFSMLRVWLYA